MTEELCFALRCRGSEQRPAFKRKCSQCVTHCSSFNRATTMDLQSHVPNSSSNNSDPNAPNNNSQDLHENPPASMQL